MLAAAIGDFNTISNYCVTTLAAQNDQIRTIPNNSLRTKMSVAYQDIQAQINLMISHHQEYFQGLTPGAEADASLARSLPNLNIPRDSATKGLMRFDVGIYNAALRR